MSAKAAPRPGHPAPASEAAARWVLRQEQGPLSDAEERAFAQWIGEDPAHLKAYEDANWAVDAVGRHAGEPELLALRSAALAANSNRRRLWGWTGGLGLLAASLAGVAVWTGSPSLSPTVGTGERVAERRGDPNTSSYRTGIGERSAITLPDGSVATLDTDSRIRVAYAPDARGVYLLKGQALFQVAHGKSAPFQVYAGNQRITAVGTTFNVRLEGEEVRVSMVEGVVRVRPIAPPAQAATVPIKELTLSAGDGLVAQPLRPVSVTSIQVERVTSWKGGVLMFNDTRLSDAVAEINRYTTRPIAIADGAAGQFRISGVFKTNDPERFSQAMTEILPIEIRRGSNGEIALSASPR